MFYARKNCDLVKESGRWLGCSALPLHVSKIAPFGMACLFLSLNSHVSLVSRKRVHNWYFGNTSFITLHPSHLSYSITKNHDLVLRDARYGQNLLPCLFSDRRREHSSHSWAMHNCRFFSLLSVGMNKRLRLSDHKYPALGNFSHTKVAYLVTQFGIFHAAALQLALSIINASIGCIKLFIMWRSVAIAERCSNLDQCRVPDFPALWRKGMNLNLHLHHVGWRP